MNTGKAIQLIDENGDLEGMWRFPEQVNSYPTVVTWCGYVYLLHDKDVDDLKDTVRYFKYEPYLIPRYI
jgi:hypothetical protein